MSDTKRDWIQRVLGYAPPIRGTLPGGKPLSVRSLPSSSLSGYVQLDESDDDDVPDPSSKGTKKSKKSKLGYEVLGEPFIPENITPSILTEKPQTFKMADGRTIEIRVGKDDAVALTAPPPPIAEITFSGGGGKGAALPGAVVALQDTLKTVSVVKGASVGSMTAALVAAGIEPDEFIRIANDKETTKRILEGRVGGKSALAHGLMGDKHKLSGEGLREVVREEMNAAVTKQIAGFLEKSGQKLPSEEELESVSLEGGRGGQHAPGDAIKAILKKMQGNSAGVTFGDLRLLHGFIPSIKEVEISAAMVGDDIGDPVAPEDMGESGLEPQLDDESETAPLLKTQSNPVEKSKPQLVMFTADTQPNVEVALACQASAALPPVFKPVEIELDSGFKGKFIDGGVLNNAPSSKTVRSTRDVDPIPKTGGMTFIFQEEKDSQAEIFKGEATPEKPGVADKITEAPHAAAEYGRKRTLADSPEDVVVVPLTFKVKSSILKREETKDFTGMLSGTVNFDISTKDKLQLQEMTKEETLAHLQKRGEPQTRMFQSPMQMLNCISMQDLDGLAKQKFPGAEQALIFRSKALEVVDALVKLELAAPGKADEAQEKKLLAALEQLAEKDPDRQGFIGREIARSGTLDGLMKRQAAANSDLGVVKAGGAVVSSIETKSNATFILQDVIYPMLVKTNAKSTKRTVLLAVDDALRSALVPDDVNDALRGAIQAFSRGKPSKDKTQFIEECKEHLMQV